MNRARIVDFVERIKSLRDNPHTQGNTSIQICDYVVSELDALLEICDVCDGRGAVCVDKHVMLGDIMKECSVCHGTGETPEEVKPEEKPVNLCTAENPCCDRRDEYNGFASGPLIFECPKHCGCHD